MILVKGHSDFKVKCLILACIHRWAIQGLRALLFKKSSCQLLRKYVHEVLVNHLGGLSLPRKSVVRLTDRPDMTLDVYRVHKTTIQQQNQKYKKTCCFSPGKGIA